MNHWIFQARAETYDLRDEANLYDGQKGWWRVSRYRTRMSVGDLVYFWLGGPEAIRGIYGWGTLTSDPFQKNGGFRVDYTIGKRLRSHIPIGALRANPELADLMILNMAIGSNFLISRAEAAAIREMMPRELQPEGPRHG